MKVIKLLVLSFFISSTLFAQENFKISKGEIKNLNEGFKEAWENLRTAENLYEHGKAFYSSALEYYLDVYKYNNINARLNYKIGLCYLYSDQKQNGVKFFKEAYAIDSILTKDLFYWMGRSFHICAEFDSALYYYDKYKKILTPREYKEVGKRNEKKILECKNGIEFIKTPVRVIIENAGSNINSAFDDYNPLISANEAMMFFVSKRTGTTGDKKKPNGEFFDDIYISYKENNEWTAAINAGPPLSTEYSDAIVGIAPDGQQLLVYNGRIDKGNLFISKLKGDIWSEPKSVTNKINTDFRERSASFSPDGRTLFFVSDRDDVNFGKLDIYQTSLNKNGKWTKPINLGNTVNSRYNETAVFMLPDGKTLYFSSEGHKSMGGYDIFKTEFNDGKWSKPVNIGYPINSPDNDFYFVMAASGNRAYYSSVKPDGFGENDIYIITYLHPEKLIQSNEDNLIAGEQETISEKVSDTLNVFENSVNLTLLSGVVCDNVSGKFINADVEIVDNELNEVIANFKSNSKTGNYLVSLPSGKNYGITVKADGYLFYSENLNTKKLIGYQDIRRDISLTKISIGASIVLGNVFFESGKSELNKESSYELKRIVKLMNDNPLIKIEISGHTDNMGNKAANQNLSTDRAKAVVEYLILHNIKTDRLTYKGYAATKSIVSNATPEGRQKNRRVEFTIIDDK